MKPMNLVVSAALMMIGSQSFAGHNAKDLKSLDDAAAALAPTNPDLSGRLKDLASREAKPAPLTDTELPGGPDVGVRVIVAPAATVCPASTPAASTKRATKSKRLRTISLTRTRRRPDRIPRENPS